MKKEKLEYKLCPFVIKIIDVDGVKNGIEFPEVECKFGYNCYNSRDKMYQNCVIYKNNKND